MKIVTRILVFLGAALCLLPIILLLSGSFMGEQELSDVLGSVLGEDKGFAIWHFIPLYPTFKNIINLYLFSPEYYILFWNSVKIVVLILFGQIFFAVPATWGLVRNKNKFAKILQGIYMFCMILPFQVTMLSQYIVLNQFKMINTHWSIILPLVFSTFPIFIMYSSFEKVPDSVVDAAKLDGAGNLRILLWIAAPIAKKGIITAFILGFLEYWNLVEQPVVFLKDKFLLPLSVYMPDFQEGNAGRAFAFAFFSCIPSILIFLLGKDALGDGLYIGSADD